MADTRAEPVEHVMDFKGALTRVGLVPEEIPVVIQTHLMYDQCANSKRLHNASFVVHKKEGAGRGL